MHRRDAGSMFFDWQILKPFHRKLDRIMDQFADEQIDAVLLDAFQRQIEALVQIAGEENPLAVRAFEQERKRDRRAVGQTRHVVVAVCRHLDVAIVENLPFLEDLEMMPFGIGAMAMGGFDILHDLQ